MSIGMKEKMLIEADPSFIMNLGLNKEPDNWQKDLLRRRPKQSLLLCSRQSGKSTTSAALVLYEALFNCDSLVLIISKAFRQAEELFRIVKKGVFNLIGRDEIIRENQSTIELKNGSRVISLPGKEESIRSYSSVALLVIDEAAQVSDELYATIRPMLAVSRGKLIALTTPFGKRGWFFHSWEGDSSWYRVKITANECPRITEEFLANEKKAVGEWWVKQEYFCEFVDTDDQLFTYDLIENLVSDKYTSWEKV